MIELRKTAVYDRWLRSLRDRNARARIEVRVDRLRLGNAGDARPVGEGVSELRIHYGPGYRIYFIRQADVLILLLCGGHKGSQDSGIVRAKSLAKEWES